MNTPAQVDIRLEHIISRSENQVSADINGETVMMSVEHGSYFGLDTIGSRIWSLIENPISVANIIDILIAEYEVTRNACTVDVIRFLSDLYGKGLIQRR